MKSLPFSAPMMVANLADIKTETRRIPKKSGKPRFAVGELGFAQEAWRLGDHLDDCSPLACSPSDIYFTADESWYFVDGMTPFRAELALHSPGRLRASMHLPERFTRFKFRVVECEFQKLHDITEEQAIAEGVLYEPSDGFDFYRGAASLSRMFDNPIFAYADLWEHINGSLSWALNPLIERIRYERIPL